MRFTIPGRLPGLNESFNEARRNKYIEASNRKKYEEVIAWCAKRDLGRWKPTEPVVLHYHFFEENRRRDKDNVASYAMKLIQDALRKIGYLSGDGWNQIENFDFEWDVDKKNPRIEVEIEEAVKVESNCYDIEEVHPDCTVQILKNSLTGEHSWGWKENGGKDECLHLSSDRW